MRANSLEIGIVFSKCIPFLKSIGIETIFRKIETLCFLPGLLIENGHIIIDRDQLLYPGDILHEAGHIAVTPAADRGLLNNQAVLESKSRETEEMMAIAWSYAACIYLELDPLIVFHESGYNGTGENIMENFRSGRFFGIPSLQWCGMTMEPGNSRNGDVVYPEMMKWLRD
jgi:hypothetical protein